MTAACELCGQVRHRVYPQRPNRLCRPCFERTPQAQQRAAADLNRHWHHDEDTPYVLSLARYFDEGEAPGAA